MKEILSLKKRSCVINYIFSVWTSVGEPSNHKTVQTDRGLIIFPNNCRRIVSLFQGCCLYSLHLERWLGEMKVASLRLRYLQHTCTARYIHPSDARHLHVYRPLNITHSHCVGKWPDSNHGRRGSTVLRTMVRHASSRQHYGRKHLGRSMFKLPTGTWMSVRHYKKKNKVKLSL
jgi:hypothetical protein